MRAFALLTGLLALVLPAAVLAQPRPPGSPAEPKDAMTFRLVAANPEAPPEKQQRWISASGAITIDTPKRFDAFLKTVTLDETLTIYFDSKGGSILGGLQLGEQLRAARARVAIGRSTPVGEQPPATATDRLPRHQLLPNLGLCYSSCAYAFLGGKHRHVAIRASFGVHMFWPGDQIDGIFGRSYRYTDIERAQRISARIASYLQRMGIDVRLLDLAASAPPKGGIRRLSPREILDLKVGTLVIGGPLFAGPGQWGLVTGEDTAALATGGTHRPDKGTPIRYVVEIGCHEKPGFHTVRFEQTPLAPTPAEAPLVLRRALLVAGPASATIASTGRDIRIFPPAFPRQTASQPGQWIGSGGIIPDDVLGEALKSPAAGLRIEIEGDNDARHSIPIPIGDLASRAPLWRNACDKLRAAAAAPH